MSNSVCLSAISEPSTAAQAPHQNAVTPSWPVHTPASGPHSYHGWKPSTPQPFQEPYQAPPSPTLSEPATHSWQPSTPHANQYQPSSPTRKIFTGTSYSPPPQVKRPMSPSGKPKMAVQKQAYKAIQANQLPAAARNKGVEIFRMQQERLNREAAEQGEARPFSPTGAPPESLDRPFSPTWQPSIGPPQARSLSPTRPLSPIRRTDSPTRRSFSPNKRPLSPVKGPPTAAKPSRPFSPRTFYPAAAPPSSGPSKGIAMFLNQQQKLADPDQPAPVALSNELDRPITPSYGGRPVSPNVGRYVPPVHSPNKPGLRCSPLLCMV